MLDKPNSNQTTRAGIETVLHRLLPKVSLQIFFCPLWYLSLSHPLTATPPSPSFHSFPLSRGEKQTAVRIGLPDEFQMALKDRRAERLPQWGRLVTHIVEKQAHKQHHMNMAHSMTAPPAPQSGVKLLFESILHFKSAYCQGEGSVCVRCVCSNLWVVAHTLCMLWSVCVCVYRSG